jgi:DNA-binding transcriptional LysR family regulator
MGYFAETHFRVGQSRPMSNRRQAAGRESGTEDILIISTYNLARFDLVSIRLAVACAQTGSLTLAARDSNLALAAASRRIHDLENALGTPLFKRHARGLLPTPAGGVFVKHGLSMLQNMEQLCAELGDLQQGVSRHISLYASSAAITEFLPPLLAQFSRLHPQIRLDVEEVVSEVAVSALREGRTDVAVFVEGPDTADLCTKLFRHDELILVMPAKHWLAGARSPVEFNDTLDEEWISLTAGAAMLQNQQQAALRANRPLKLRMQMRSFEAVCHMVAAGLGIAILPKVASLPIIKAMKLRWRPLADAWAQRRLLVATTGGEHDGSVNALVEFLMEPAPDDRPTRS